MVTTPNRTPWTRWVWWQSFMLRLYWSLSEGNSSPALGQALTGNLLLNQDASGDHWKRGRVAEAESLCDTENETVLTHGGGTCLRCHPYYEPGRRRTSEQRCVKPLVKLVWLWEISTALRGKVTSRVFCPSAPVVGEDGCQCGAVERGSRSWGKAGCRCSREGQAALKGLLLDSQGELPWLVDSFHCPGAKRQVWLFRRLTSPNQTSRLTHSRKGTFSWCFLKWGCHLLEEMSPGNSAVVGPSIPFSCFCQWKVGCVDETSSWKD